MSKELQLTKDELAKLQDLLQAEQAKVLEASEEVTQLRATKKV